MKNGCKSQTQQCGKDGGCNSEFEFVKCVLYDDSVHRTAEKSKCSKWKRKININKIIKKSRRKVLHSYNMRENSFDILSDNESYSFIANFSSK